MCKCVCGSVTIFSGDPNCQSIAEVADTIWLVPYVNSAGVTPSFNTNTLPLPANTFSNLVNSANPLDRIYPIRKIKNVANVRGERIRETFNDGTEITIRKGNRTFNALLPNVGHQYYSNVENLQCGKWGVWIVTKSGQIIGDGSTLGQIKPLPIQDGTFVVDYDFKTDTTSSKIMISFTFDSTFCDSSLFMLEGANLTNENPLSINGLLPVGVIEVGAGTTTTAQLRFYTAYGTHPIYSAPPTAITLANLTAKNINTGLAVALTSVTLVAGTTDTYNIVFPAQTAGHSIALTLSGKTGFGGIINNFTV